MINEIAASLLPSVPLPKNEHEEPSEIVDRLCKTKNMLEQAYIVFARDLWYVKGNKHIYTNLGFETFDDFVRGKVGISKDSAERAVSIFQHFVVRCNVNLTELTGIGRGRATLIKPIVNSKNAKEWVSKAKELPWDKLNREVEAEKDRIREERRPRPAQSSGDAEDSGEQSQSLDIVEHMITVDHVVVSPRVIPKEERPFVRREFFITEDTDTLLDEALSEAQRVTRSPSASFNFSLIVQHFLAHRLTQEGKSDGRLYYHLRHMERIFGGHLIHVKDEEGWRILAKAMESCPEHFGTTKKGCIDGSYDDADREDDGGNGEHGERGDHQAPEDRAEEEA